MSKMGQVYMSLDEQAQALGYESLDEAMRAGYKWTIEKVDGVDCPMLYEPDDDLSLEGEIAYQNAHIEYEAEKADLVGDLEVLMDAVEDKESEIYKTLAHAQKFIKEAKL